MVHSCRDDGSTHRNGSGRQPGATGPAARVAGSRPGRDLEPAAERGTPQRNGGSARSRPSWPRGTPQVRGTALLEALVADCSTEVLGRVFHLMGR